MQNWYAPARSSSRETGLGKRDESEIVDLLRTGVSARGAVYGPMAVVVQQSLQGVTPADLRAMAVYLKSRAQAPAPPEPPRIEATAPQTAALMGRRPHLHPRELGQRCAAGVGRGSRARTGRAGGLTRFRPYT